MTKNQRGMVDAIEEALKSGASDFVILNEGKGRLVVDGQALEVPLLSPGAPPLDKDLVPLLTAAENHGWSTEFPQQWRKCPEKFRDGLEGEFGCYFEKDDVLLWAFFDRVTSGTSPVEWLKGIKRIVGGKTVEHIDHLGATALLFERLEGWLGEGVTSEADELRREAGWSK